MTHSTQQDVLLQTDFPELELYASGKVRDLYRVDREHLLFVATDRISAFDYVLATGIPFKGHVLTQLSLFWFDFFKDVVPSHVVTSRVEDYPGILTPYADLLRGRSMLVLRAEMVAVECVVRGYLAGSGWKEYQVSGAVSGINLPRGLRQAEKLPEPVFTPATKSTEGHDENISFEEMNRLAGPAVSRELREMSLLLYRRAAEYAASRGILIADTKFEFGIRGARLILADEVLTPDSSRFWPADGYEPGRSQESFDKQYVRDYLESVRWNKQPPAPSLPAEVAARTSEKYIEAFRRLSGRELEL